MALLQGIFLAMAFLIWPASASAQSGWLPTSWFPHAKTNPRSMYPLSDRSGPWLVLATTFRGDGARDDARRLVQELQTDYKLTAYTHEKAFDFTGEQRGLGLNPDGSPKKMRYANSTQILEVAVMVGDFASCDDSRAQKRFPKSKDFGLRRSRVTRGKAVRSQTFVACSASIKHRQLP